MRDRLVTLSMFVIAAALLLTPGGHALAAAPPTITSMTPLSATTSGGTLLTIYGTGFEQGAYVAIGGVLSSSVTVLNASALTAVIPAGTAGAAQVVVVNPDGQSVFASGFSYAAPSTSSSGSLSLVSIAPLSAAATGGQLVYVTGAGFDPNAVITFGGIPVASMVWMNQGFILTYAPAGSGTVNVVITNPNGQAATAPTPFTYSGASNTSTGSLSITSITPSSVSAGSAITITGAGFISGATVNVGGFAAPNVTVVNSSLITATAPAGPSGVVTVLVTNPGGAAATSAGLSYAGTTATSGTQPTVAAVSPPTGSSAGGTTVSITGGGFVAPATVTFGGVPATLVTVVNANLITATTPASPVGTVSVLVAGPSGAVGGLIAGYTYELAVPRVTSVSPSTGALTGGTQLTISGSGFAPGATVTVGGQPAATVSAVSPTQIIVSTPPGPSGHAVVLVTNPGGAISGLASAFSYSANPQPQAPTVSAATITGVTPATGPATGGTAITITGSGFQSGASVSIGGTAVAATVISATQISAITPPVTGTGNVTVTVANPGGVVSALPSAFNYIASAPPSTPLSTPPSLPAGGGLFVFAGGTNAQLLAASGCDASTAVFWTTNAAGAWIGYIPSVPVAVVNAAWTALFPNGIPAGTPIFARC